MLIRSFIFFILVISFCFSQAQDRVTLLIDSITFVDDPAEKARLSNKIAWELKDSDWERAIQYLEYSEEQSQISNSDEILARFYVTAADIYFDKDVFTL